MRVRECRNRNREQEPRIEEVASRSPVNPINKLMIVQSISPIPGIAVYHRALPNESSEPRTREIVSESRARTARDIQPRRPALTTTRIAP